MRVRTAVVATAALLLAACSSTGPDARGPATTTTAAPRAAPTTDQQSPSAQLGPAADDGRAAPTTTAPAPLPWGLGVFAGGPNGVRDFERWLGRPVNVVTAYLDRTSWATMLGSVDTTLPRWDGHRVRLTLGVPLLPRRGATLARGAAGAYDDHFRAIAARVVAAGRPDAVIRLGWEFDGHWYPWSGWRDPDAFVAFWRRVVEVMRSVPGQRFLFDWNSAADRTDPTPLYPGDDVVDVIGIDVYDETYGRALIDAEVRWRDLVERPGGLGWLVAFAAEHGKPISVPEWGLSSRHVDGSDPDNPRFVEGMHRFVTEHDVLYHAYFDHTDDDETWSLRSGAFPRAAEAYRALFGGPDGPAADAAPATTAGGS